MLPSRVSGLSHLLLVRWIWNYIATCSTCTKVLKSWYSLIDPWEHEKYSQFVRLTGNSWELAGLLSATTHNAGLIRWGNLAQLRSACHRKARFILLNLVYPSIHVYNQECVGAILVRQMYNSLELWLISVHIMQNVFKAKVWPSYTLTKIISLS